MAVYGDKVGMSYDEVKALIKKFGDTRIKVYDCVDQIKKILEQSNTYWKGEAADSARQAIKAQADACYSCGKWVNEMAWSLGQYADKLKELDSQQASRINSINS